MTREEAIDIVRKNYPHVGVSSSQFETALRNLIPELRDSEDERIRQDIVALIKFALEDGSAVSPGSNTTKEEALAYLEKQKELDKMIIVSPEVWDNAISDAFENGKKEGEKQKEQKPAECISHLNVQGKGVYKICPRCKERMVRDDSKVYTSMPPQYGYECPKCGEMVFDTVMYDNPEMEEQKQAEWNKNDTVFLNEITDYFENKTVRLQHDLDMYAHWLKSLPERFNLQAKQEWSEKDEKIRKTLLDYYEKALDNYTCVEWLNGITYGELCDWLKSLRPQPQKLEDWTEEDERLLGDVLGCITLVQTYKACGDLKEFKTEHTGEELRSFVRSLKSRPRKQPHWKPSEQEKGALRIAIHVLTEERSFPKTASHLQAILDAFEGKESRKDWKPSEEQLNALQYVLGDGGVYNKEALFSLYEQLKKLM